MKNIKKICIIGAGNMGGAIAGGIAKSQGFSAEDITVTAKTQATLDRLSQAHPGIHVSIDNAQAVKGADLVILAVKPWQVEDVIGQIKDSIDYDSCTVASVVAGKNFAELGAMFAGETNAGKPALYRIIPNTAIALMLSTTFIAADEGANKEISAQIDAIFSEMGETIWVEENMMAAGTSLASCGIAYALKYLDASMKGGQKIGFSEVESRQIVMNTMKGALALLENNGTMPQTEIDKVTTPGGYTFKGLTAMEEGGFSAAVLAGLEKSL